MQGQLVKSRLHNPAYSLWAEQFSNRQHVRPVWQVHTLVLLVVAASIAERSEISMKVVCMLHLAGRKDLNRANVPPARYQSVAPPKKKVMQSLLPNKARHPGSEEKLVL